MHLRTEQFTGTKHKDNEAEQKWTEIWTIMHIQVGEN